MNLYKHSRTWIIALKLQYCIFKTISFNLRLRTTLNFFETHSVALGTCLSSLFHYRIDLPNSPTCSDCATCVVSCVFEATITCTHTCSPGVFSVLFQLKIFIISDTFSFISSSYTFDLAYVSLVISALGTIFKPSSYIFMLITDCSFV